MRQKCSLQGLGVGRFFGLFDTDLAAHGAEHLSQKLSDPTLLEWEVPLAIKHPQDDIPQPRLCICSLALSSLGKARMRF